MTKQSGVHGQILHAALRVGAAGIVVKIAALTKEFVVAGCFGRSDAMDAFLVAMLLPGLLVNLISESMNQALVPTLIRVRLQQGRERAQELLSSSMLWMCLLLGAVSVAMGVSARRLFPLLGSQFPAEKLELAVHLFYGLLPVVLLAGIASNCTAVLSTEDRFGWPAVAPVAVPVMGMAGAILWGGRLGIWALVYATVAGSMVQAGWIAGLMRRSGYRVRLRWFGMTEASREVAGQYGPVLLSSVVASGGLLVDQSMAAMLPAGSVSALVYGNRFVSAVAALMAGALSTAATPYFSRMIAEKDWEGCRGAVASWVRRTAAVSIPIAVALMGGARLVVRVAYQHGAFGPRDTAVVAGVMAMYAIQIPFFACSRVYYRLIVAMRRTDLVLWCGVLNLGLDVVLNLVLMRWMGVAGIALATSLWTVSTLLFLWFWARRLLAGAMRVNLPRLVVAG